MAWASANRLQQAWGRIADDVVPQSRSAKRRHITANTLGSVSCRLWPAMAVQNRAGNQLLESATGLGSTLAYVLTVSSRYRRGFVNRKSLDGHEQERLALRLGEISHGRLR